MTAEEYLAIKHKLDTLQRKVDQTEGALKQAMLEIQRTFQCTTIAEAEALIDELKQLEKELATEITTLERQFKRKWKDVLDELP